MSSNKQPIYLQDGNLVIDTVQQRVAAEISLKTGILARQRKSLENDLENCYIRYLTHRSHFRKENDFLTAKETLKKFHEKLEPLRQSIPQTLQGLQADLKELEELKTTLSMTDPEYLDIEDYIDFRTEQINILQNKLTERYEAGLEKLAALSTSQEKNNSPWEGKYTRNHYADLHSLFLEKKVLITEKSLKLLEITLTLLEKKPAQAGDLVERVKKEFTQQEQVATIALAPSIPKQTPGSSEEEQPRNTM